MGFSIKWPINILIYQLLKKPKKIIFAPIGNLNTKINTIYLFFMNFY